uniref:Uncharacterized protein n=1 Tax=Anguilla anguilla TaxID=7936 RepID=A0A0E9VF84_ANGAN
MHIIKITHILTQEEGWPRLPSFTLKA